MTAPIPYFVAAIGVYVLLSAATYCVQYILNDLQDGVATRMPWADRAMVAGATTLGLWLVTAGLTAACMPWVR